MDRSLFRFRCGVDRSYDRERIGAWIGVIFVECVELGSLLGLGVDRSLAASSRERIGVERSLAASSLDRGASVWVVPFGSVCGSEQ